MRLELLVVGVASLCAASPCVLSTYTSIYCLNEGDFGSVGEDMRMCTVCNLYIAPTGEFEALQDPNPVPAPPPYPRHAVVTFSNNLTELMFKWKPSTTFAPYYIPLKSAHARISQNSLTNESFANYLVENTTTYIVPRLQVCNATPLLLMHSG